MRRLLNEGRGPGGLVKGDFTRVEDIPYRSRCDNFLSRKGKTWAVLVPPYLLPESFPFKKFVC
jgi:hypothetical protein